MDEGEASKVGAVILNKTLRDEWNRSLSVHQNLSNMGLAVNPNKAVTKPTSKIDELVKGYNFISKEIKPSENKTKSKNSLAPKKIRPVDVFEKEVNDFVPADKDTNFGQEWRLFCIFMMDRYKDDYKAMARDPRNYYQETPNRIKGKIKNFVKNKKFFSEYCTERDIPEDAARFVKP